jgi:hypothetical protein
MDFEHADKEKTSRPIKKTNQNFLNSYDGFIKHPPTLLIVQVNYHFFLIIKQGRNNILSCIPFSAHPLSAPPLSTKKIAGQTVNGTEGCYKIQLPLP